MKTFYEMIAIMEQETEISAAGGQQIPQEQGPESPEEGLGDERSPEVEDKSEEIKNYMFFSNLKAIKEKVEAMLAMDQHEVDAMLEDGHDWASDHIATSKDDIEEVHNWLSGEKVEGEATP